MIVVRKTGLKKASSSFRSPWNKTQTRGAGSQANSHGPKSSSPSWAAAPEQQNSSRLLRGPIAAHRSPFASISESQKHKKLLDRDFLLSVLETSVTKRDARGYITKFVPLLERKGATSFKQQASQSREKGAPTTTTAAAPAQAQAQTSSTTTTIAAPTPEADVAVQEPLYVALVKLRAPQDVDDATLLGIGRTLTQLRKLGLISVVVVDCDAVAGNAAQQRRAITQQAHRIAMGIDSCDQPGARIIDSPITIASAVGKSTSPFTSDDLFISKPYDLMSALQDEIIPVVPSIGYTEDFCNFRTVDANDAMVALARQLSGLQVLGQPSEDAQMTRLLRAAEVYRLIILDPVGGIPAKNRATGRYMFLNLEQELEEVTKHLAASSSSDNHTRRTENEHHLRNAELAKRALSLLPPTSSAVITTPQEAANERSPDDEEAEDLLDWGSFVGTRRKLNPLIHNLLTDKPVQSSSLPSGRFRPVVSASGAAPRIGSLTTLAKRGMPVTILPDPRAGPWRPPSGSGGGGGGEGGGEHRFNLTDASVCLPRLVHLINDSFGRRLDVDHYLKRVEGNLAGIIIAGEYEGGAILTWEKPPPGLYYNNTTTTTTEEPPLVPYLDKFAVLRKSQGAGGVADIVFNAMVRECFPEGVCWRSRKDNPVNKWYFERSRGAVKIADTNWTMFWTTPDVALDGPRYRAYEAVCRGVEPSWEEKGGVVD